MSDSANDSYKVSQETKEEIRELFEELFLKDLNNLIEEKYKEIDRSIKKLPKESDLQEISMTVNDIRDELENRDDDSPYSIDVTQKVQCKPEEISLLIKEVKEIIAKEKMNGTELKSSEMKVSETIRSDYNNTSNETKNRIWIAIASLFAFDIITIVILLLG